MSTFASNIPDHETIRLVGWGTMTDLATSIRPRLFGLLVERAASVVQEFVGDLYHDALWLEANVAAKTMPDGGSFRFLIRRSGTTLGPFATYMASTHHYDYVLFDVVLHHDERMDWSVTFDVVQRGEPSEPVYEGPKTRRSPLAGVEQLAEDAHETLRLAGECETCRNLPTEGGDDEDYGMRAGFDDGFDDLPVESVPPAPDAVTTQPATWWDFETRAGLDACEYYDSPEATGCIGPRVGVEKYVGGNMTSGKVRCEKHLNSTRPPKRNSTRPPKRNSILTETPEGVYYTGPLVPAVAVMRSEYGMDLTVKRDDKSGGYTVTEHRGSTADNPNQWGTGPTEDEAWRYLIGADFGPLDDTYEDEGYEAHQRKRLGLDERPDFD